MPAPERTELKTMRLRYAGSCRSCGASLPAGTIADYDRTHKQVQCVECVLLVSPEYGIATARTVDPPSEDRSQTDLATDRSQDLGPNVAEVIDPGTAGGSARREYERRVAKRESRVRAAHPRIGGFLLAVSDEPQSTRAWEVGAVGEERLAKILDALTDRGVRALHDRRIPGTKANIDHIVVSPGGVFVIDAKRYKGRPALRIEGGLIRPRTETLLVGRRDCTKLVAGVTHQVELTRAALVAGGLAEVPVSGMLCFVDADWPLLGGSFNTSAISVLWPRKACERICAVTVLSSDEVLAAYQQIARTFPVA